MNKTNLYLASQCQIIAARFYNDAEQSVSIRNKIYFMKCAKNWSKKARLYMGIEND